MTDRHQNDYRANDERYIEPNLPLVPPDFGERQKRQRELAAVANDANRAAVFDALASTGIREVIVEFDGEGDSGQIEHLQASDANGVVALPDRTVEMASAPWDCSELVTRREPIGEAIETLCYALLSEHHGGWEINDGSYGLFTLDVPKRTIELTHHERYVAAKTSEYAY